MITQKNDPTQEALPYLHLGYAFLNLIFIPINLWVLEWFKTLIQLPEIKEALIELYGTDFSFLFLYTAQFHSWIYIFVILASTINLWAFWLFKYQNQSIWIKRIAWINLGLPPWGTALGVITLVSFKEK